MKNFSYSVKIMILLIFCYLSEGNLKAQSQNMGIGTITPDNSAILDLTSTTMGFLVPRMTSAEKSAINGGAPATGLIIYQTDAPSGLYYFNGSLWLRITPEGWSLTGNSATNPIINFLGTSDAQPLVIKTNNAERIRILATGETGIGTSTPLTNLHIYENNPDTEPALRIQQNSIGNASQMYLLSLNGKAVSAGIDNLDNQNYKINNTTSLNGLTYNSANIMMRIHTETGSEGIIDFNHQSRSRAYRNADQLVTTGTWTKILFNAVSFDEKSEFDAVTNKFTAKEEGYYQVNARTEFDFSSATDVNPDSYIAIAVYVNGIEYSLGNKLGLSTNNTRLIRYNCAPVVADVIYLQAGQTVEIFVYQNTGYSYNLLYGPSVTYASIHKAS